MQRQIGSATLHLGDCREILPTLSGIDAIVTDPPYGTSYVGGYNRAGDLIANDDDLTCVAEALSLAPTRNAVVFCSPRERQQFYDALGFLNWYGAMVWDKRAPGLGGLGLRYQHEEIALAGDPSLWSAIFSVLSVYRDAEEHPHQKPLPLMMRLLEAYKAQSVVDPFMGSGTTGVACARLGRRFVGIEINPRYFDVACRRIDEACGQGELFVDLPAVSEPEQTELLRVG